MREIVPPAVLAPPDTSARGFDRPEAALVLDGHLRRLAAQEKRCRLILGRLARAFLAREGVHELGFARLGDWARERLGVSGREVQSLAGVASRLEQLPLLRTAFAQDELSWSQLRLLVTVAAPETEADWLARAQRRTVRALAALIRQTGTEAREDEQEEAEPRIGFSLRCPRRIVRLWRDVYELARRMAGSELSVAQAAEAIAAEGLTARPAAREPWPESWRPATAPADPDETSAAFAPDLDWTIIAEALPDDVAQLAEDAEHVDALPTGHPRGPYTRPRHGARRGRLGDRCPSRAAAASPAGRRPLRVSPMSRPGDRR